MIAINRTLIAHCGGKIIKSL